MERSRSFLYSVIPLTEQRFDEQNIFLHHFMLM